MLKQSCIIIFLVVLTGCTLGLKSCPDGSRVSDKYFCPPTETKGVSDRSQTFCSEDFKQPSASLEEVRKYAPATLSKAVLDDALPCVDKAILEHEGCGNRCYIIAYFWRFKDGLEVYTGVDRWGADTLDYRGPSIKFNATMCNEEYNVRDNDMCLMQAAKDTNKTSFCDEIKEGPMVFYCKAYFSLDVWECGGIQDTILENECYLRIAYKTGNSSICNKINPHPQSQTNLVDCYMHTGTPVTVETCMSLWANFLKSDCINRLANMTNELSYCDALKLNSTEVGNSYDCYSQIAQWRKNETICQNIPVGEFRGTTSNLSHTEKGYLKDGCLSGVVVQLQRSGDRERVLAICDNMQGNNSRAHCLSIARWI